MGAELRGGLLDEDVAAALPRVHAVDIAEGGHGGFDAEEIVKVFNSHSDVDDGFGRKAGNGGAAHMLDVQHQPAELAVEAIPLGPEQGRPLLAVRHNFNGAVFEARLQEGGDS